MQSQIDAATMLRELQGSIVEANKVRVEGYHVQDLGSRVN